MTRHQTLRSGLFALAAALALVALPAHAAKPLPRDSVYHLPATLTAQDGRDFAWKSLRGKPRVVAMFYTSCKVVCPLIIDSAKAVENALPAPERARMGVVLVSLDPASDTPDALLGVFDKRKLDAARWIMARPEAKDVAPIAAVLGVRYRALANGDFNHTSALVLLDAEGRVVARTEKLGGAPDPEFVAQVRAAL